VENNDGQYNSTIHTSYNVGRKENAVMCKYQLQQKIDNIAQIKQEGPFLSTFDLVFWTSLTIFFMLKQIHQRFTTLYFSQIGLSNLGVNIV